MSEREGGEGGREEGCERRMGKKRERWGAVGEQLTLFSDKRAEYRLERQKKDRNTENKEQGESNESVCRTETMKEEHQRTSTLAGDLAGGGVLQVYLMLVIKSVTQD